MEIKVGDKVKSIKKYENQYGENVGLIGHIVSVYGNLFTVEFNSEFQFGHDGRAIVNNYVAQGECRRCWNYDKKDVGTCLYVMSNKKKKYK